MLRATWMVILASVLLTPSPALAHSDLVRTEPADGAALERPPEQVRVFFNEPVEAPFSPLEVYDDQGRRVDEGNAGVDPADPSVLLVGLKDLDGGTYRVEYRITGEDGHPIGGNYTFSVKEQRPEETTADETTVVEAESASNATGAASEEGNSSPVMLYTAASLAALVLIGAAGFALRRR